MNKEIAIVTGATKGIGLAIAKQLAADGYRVIGTYVSPYSEAAIKNLETVDFSLVRVDARDPQACLDFAKCVFDQKERVGVMVNNAGIVRDVLMMRMSLEDFTEVIDTNLVGTFNMVKAFTKGLLKQRGGAIINISSVVGVSGNVGQANYAASKAGLIGFSKSLAREFASRQIRVNCIAPGFIETDMTDGLDDKTKAAIADNIALGHIGKADDIAQAVSYLAKANYVTGQTLNVCGGMII